MWVIAPAWTRLDGYVTFELRPIRLGGVRRLRSVIRLLAHSHSPPVAVPGAQSAFAPMYHLRLCRTAAAPAAALRSHPERGRRDPALRAGLGHSEATTTVDVGLCGQVVPARPKVLLLTGRCLPRRAARRPAQRVRCHPQRRQSHGLRMGHPHLHRCPRARLEGRIALEETLARFPSWTVDEPGTAMRSSTNMRGYSRLLITF